MAQQKEITCKNMGVLWKKIANGISEGTRIATVRNWGNFAKHIGEDSLVSTVSKDMVMEYYDYLMKTPMETTQDGQNRYRNEKTAYSIVNCIKRVLGGAVRLKLIGTNPCTGLKIPSHGDKNAPVVRNHLDMDQVEALCSAMFDLEGNWTNTKNVTFIYLVAACKVKKSAVLKLTTDNIGADGSITFGSGKKAKKVMLDAFGQKLLSNYQALAEEYLTQWDTQNPKGYLFFMTINDGGGETKANSGGTGFNSWFSTFLKNQDLPHVEVDSLRDMPADCYDSLTDLDADEEVYRILKPANGGFGDYDMSVDALALLDQLCEN